MTLRDLLKRCRYKDIFNIIHAEYYRGKVDEDVYGADLGYRKVVKNLLKLPYKPSEEYQIYLRETEELGDKFTDVCLYCEEDEEIYAIDFTSWEELIDAEIKDSLSLDNDSVLAHILWEITFYGYDNTTVQAEKDRLEKQIERIESGEEKLIPWKDSPF